MRGLCIGEKARVSKELGLSGFDTVNGKQGGGAGQGNCAYGFLRTRRRALARGFASRVVVEAQSRTGCGRRSSLPGGSVLPSPQASSSLCERNFGVNLSVLWGWLSGI